MKIEFSKLVKIPGYKYFGKWDEEGGPFRSFSVRSLSDEDPRWYLSSLLLSNFPIGSVQPLETGGAAGSSIYMEDAITSCIGEGFERYSSANYFMKEMPIMKKVDYTMGYIRCADEENAPVSFKKNGIHVPIEHTQVLKMTDDSIHLIPYELVHLGFQKQNVDSLFSSPISTGCAFHSDKISALKRGLEEVIERHALMTWWYGNMEKCKVINAYELFEYDIHERISRIEEKGLTIKFFEISPIDGFPVVFCMLVGENFPYFTCGASCNTNIKKAIVKAIDESVALRFMAKFLGRRQVNTKDFSWIQNLENHLILYANWKDSPIAKTLLAMERTIVSVEDFGEITLNTMDELRQQAYRLGQIGYDIYYKDLTMDEIKPIGVVYRVIVPQMMPLVQAENIRWLSSLLASGKTMADINPLPQPFS